MTEVSKEAVEALADAWASIDGNKAVRDKERELDVDIHGFLGGYTDDAAEMISRLETRGFTITRAETSLSPEQMKALENAEVPKEHEHLNAELKPAMSEAELEREARELSLYAGNNSYPDGMTMSVLDAIKLAQKYRRM